MKKLFALCFIGAVAASSVSAMPQISCSKSCTGGNSPSCVMWEEGGSWKCRCTCVAP